MLRRQFSLLCGVALTAPLTALANPGARIGVLMLHGKSPGSNQDPNFSPMRVTLEREGWLVAFPDMPWSRTRYLDGHWDKAMSEIAGHVKALQDQGATKIVLMGHSLGVPAAMSFAARGGTVHGLVLLAPGHVPRGYYTVPRLKPVRESIDEARALVAAGKADESQSFNDINQGRHQPVIATPKNFLSYFDPESDAEMSVTAPRIPATVPVFTAIGEQDPLFKGVRDYYVNKLPAHPDSQYLEVAGGHLDTPRLASDPIVAWIRKAVANR